MMQCMTQQDITDILEAFEDSRFANIELTAGPVRLAANRVPVAPVRSVDLLADTTRVVAPLLGMFQAGPEPGAPAFVHLGTKLQPDTTVGIIRVMQHRTAVKAGLSGTVVEIPVHDGQLVEFGQTLLRASVESAAIGDCAGCGPESNRASAR